MRKLRNLGRASVAMLRTAGIVSDTQLREKGAAAAFLAVKRAGASPTLNLLWAIEGALADRDWREIARDKRLSLLMQLEDLERRQH